MMTVGLLGILGLVAASIAAGDALAAPKERSVGVNQAQVRAWNRFAESVHRVHLHMLKGRDVRTTERIGGYSGRPKFYREVAYHDRRTGRLLSRVQWERARPGTIHAVEVFFYDQAGRLAREYGAYYLPGARNAPIQTLVNFHAYDGVLHAFRQWDASGERIYERCTGTWFDEAVNISLPEPLIATPPALLASEAYTACFGFLPASAGAALDPANGIPELARSSGEEEDTARKARLRITEYTLRLKLAPRSAGLYVKRGDAHFQLLELDKAIADFSRAIELDDSRDQAYFGRGMALGRRGHLDEAIADLTVFVRRNPNSSLGLTKRGVRYIWKGDLAKAETDLQRAIALDPANAEAHDDLGVVLARRGAYEQAVTHFATTIGLEPSYQKAHHNLALVRHLLGRHGEALASVDTALGLGQRTRSSMLLKAAILEAMGRREEAEAFRTSAEQLPRKSWSENLAVK